MSVPVVSIVGCSNVGKTTLLEKLIPELKRRGHRVATIKHDVHGFEVDQPGKDTWRHAQAGADLVVIAAPKGFAMIARTEQEMQLDALLARLPVDVDLVLTEGYKRGDKPKIEVSRAERGRGLVGRPEELIAIATDQPYPEVDVPQYGLEDVRGLAQLIEEKVIRGTSHSHNKHCNDGPFCFIEEE